MADKFDEMFARANKAAPYPRDPETATAQAWIRRAAAYGAIHAVATFDGPDKDYKANLREAVNCYEVARLLRALVEHAPEHADEVARDITSALDDGAIGETLWEWATDAGVDMDALMGDEND